MIATPGVIDGSLPEKSGTPLLRPITLNRSKRILAAAVFSFCAILWQFPPRDVRFLALVLLVGFTSLFVVLRAPAPPGTPAHRRFPWVPLLVLLALLLNVGYESCPHARYASLGPVIIAINGKPCHNQRHPQTLVTWLAGVRSAWWS